MRRTWLKFVLLLYSAAALPGGSRAQTIKQHKEAPGSVDGVVVNAKGAPVAGAMVLWQIADGEKPQILRSDAQGHFQIPRLRPGLYDVRASAEDVSSDWARNVLVRPGAASSLKLRLAAVAAPVKVTFELKGKMRTWDVPAGASMPLDSAADPLGNVWFTLQDAGQLARFTPDTQEWKLFRVPAENSGPNGLASDPKGIIWFTENSGKIGRLDPRSSLVTEYSAPTARDPRNPVVGPDGAIWFSAQNSNLIGRVDVTTGQITEFSVPTQNAHPYGMVSADDGGLWFCELSGQKLGRVDPRTGQVSEFALPDSDVHPRGLAAGPGAVYITDFGSGRLGRFTISEKKFQLWDTPSGVGSQPYGIAVDSTGKVWYEESAEKANQLVRVDPATLKFTVYPMPEKSSVVRSISRDARGRLWMPLSKANKVMLVE